MPGGGTRTFLGADHFEASLREAQIEAVIVPRSKFKARLTWADLLDIEVLRCEEDSPRVAYVHLPPQLAFVMFSANSGPLPVWRGTELEAEEIAFGARGDRLHQSTPALFVWNVIGMELAQLEYYGRALTGKSLFPSSEGRILRPSQRNIARLRRLHGQTCRLAETNPRMLSHSEVARSIAQDLIQASVACLTTSRTRTGGSAACEHAGIMVRFEEILAERLDQRLNTRALCELVGVGERMLRLCCAEFLGMTPLRYVQLRRLREAHSTLRDADPDTVQVAEVAQRFGFR
jgi:AraC-like DNA-binding protein